MSTTAPGPNPFPCGGKNQPACPPVPTAVTNGVALYTAEQMHAHGQASYEKGRADARHPEPQSDDL